MSSELAIRGPNPEDVGALSDLLHELGYPTTRGVVAGQLGKMALDPDICILVAEREKDVVGLATGQMLLVIQHEYPLAMLMALVVRDGVRGVGVGKKLVEGIEAWGRARGAHRIVVTSGLARTEAHAFYEHIGYEHTAHRFSRSL